MNWSQDNKELIDNALLEASTLEPSQKIAVFDADGTLWPGDIGESFFQYQFKNDLAPGLKNVVDPWGYYKDLEAQDPFAAYSWLLKINQGLHFSDLKKQTRNFVNQGFDSISSPMVQLLKILERNQFQIWICSASMKWVIESLLEARNLYQIKLIGFEAQLDDKGFITNRIQWPMPYSDGKKEALSLKLTHPPFMCFGNSMGDLKILEWAERLPMVIRYAPFNPVNIKTESRVGEIAKARGWPIQIF